MSKFIHSTKIFLATKFKLLYYFYKQLGKRLFYTLLFNCLVVLMDGFGLTLFIPLLKIAGSSQEEQVQPDRMTEVIKTAFDSIHLPLTIPVVLGFITLVFILKGVFTYFTTVFQGETIGYFARDLRSKNVNLLSRLSYKAFVSSDFGQLQNTLTSEIYRVEQSAYNYIDTLKNILIVIVYLGMSMVVDYKFSLMVIVMGLIFNYFYKFFYQKTRERSAEITKVGHDLNSYIMQSLYNFKYMKATGVIQEYKKKTLNVIQDILHINIAITKVNSFLQSIREPMMIIIVSIVILVQLLFFKAEISSIIVVLLFFYRSMANLLSLQTSWNNFLVTSGSLENIIKFDKFMVQNTEPALGTKKVSKIEQLSLKGVGLFFDSFKVLKNINVEIYSKETVAFVGESGSGKSTLVNLVCGLYLPDEGRYEVNGSDIHDINIEDLRNRIGYISQEPTVFTGTIFENVSLWAEKTPATLEKFWDAVSRSNLKDFITSLPDAENSLLGNSGINLSGGQKQRISIARELYKDIDILIMDEATSALDSETERDVQQSIEALEGELIILVIAHRLSTIVNADKIVVMKAGHIEGVGNFAELKKQSEYFNRLTALQGL